MEQNDPFGIAADKLSQLYEIPFGGKKSGRYRISAKLVREILGRRRIYEDDVAKLSRTLLEKGYVLVDMDSFFVILSANTFVNYRRVNEDCVERLRKC